jgi:hypothetical protein
MNTTKEATMTDSNDKLVLDTIFHTLTFQEQALFNKVMENEQHKIGSLGQLVSEALRRREKLGYFD